MPVSDNKAPEPQKQKTESKELQKIFKEDLKNGTLVCLGEHHNKTNGRLGLKTLIDKGLVDVVFLELPTQKLEILHKRSERNRPARNGLDDNKFQGPYLNICKEQEFPWWSLDEENTLNGLAQSQLEKFTKNSLDGNNEKLFKLGEGASLFGYLNQEHAQPALGELWEYALKKGVMPIAADPLLFEVKDVSEASRAKRDKETAKYIKEYIEEMQPPKKENDNSDKSLKKPRMLLLWGADHFEKTDYSPGLHEELKNQELTVSAYSLNEKGELFKVESSGPKIPYQSENLKNNEPSKPLNYQQVQENKSSPPSPSDKNHSRSASPTR